MQFMITAYDGTDEDALARRMSARPAHLENIVKVKEKGSVICGGGLLDEEGKMKGSVLIMEFDSREKLEEYLAGEPYVTCGVWKDIKIETCNIAIKDDKMIGR